MIVYHGSKNIIEKPIYGFGNIYNDYGLGFYCTENLSLAKEWACSEYNYNGYANIYEIDLLKLRVLDLRNSQYSILNWLAVLLKHRRFDLSNMLASEAKQYIIDNYYIDVNEYDIIIGYRADDSYFSFARDFVNNAISLEQLSEAMLLGELGIQIVLKSEKAFQKIEYKGYEIADCKEYYVRRLSRDKKAREKYFNECRKEFKKDALYVLDLIRKGI